MSLRRFIDKYNIEIYYYNSNPIAQKEIEYVPVPNFEGYSITDYIGLVSGEIVIGTGFLSDLKASVADLLGVESKAYSYKLKDAKTIALHEMIAESIENGGNAIIGISYEYVAFSGNMIGISVNGTSVKIEKMS